MILNTGYEIIFSSLIAAFLAQLLKFLFYFAYSKKINFKILTETGGMPSSHSAFVVALTTSVGIINGCNSTEFAIALGFSLVVMYDAAGLRRSAGKMAAVLNKIVDDIYTHKPATSERLIELLGHTPLEVIMGGLLGALLALGYHIILLRY
jgi:acid phosphatase family membrane protein YuiD